MPSYCEGNRYRGGRVLVKARGQGGGLGWNFIQGGQERPHREMMITVNFREITYHPVAR